MALKRILRVLALVLALSASVYWLAAGGNRGWTKNKIEVKTLDPVTGLEGVQYPEKFIPGVDFLGGALLGAALLAGASFFFRNKNKSHSEPKL